MNVFYFIKHVAFLKETMLTSLLLGGFTSAFIYIMYWKRCSLFKKIWSNLGLRPEVLPTLTFVSGRTYSKYLFRIGFVCASHIGIKGILSIGIKEIKKCFLGAIFKPNPSLTMDKKYCTIRYEYKDNIYKIKFERPRNVTSILTIKDDRGIDVTNCVKEYMGPFNNFHTIPTTPKMLGYETLEFTMLDNVVLKFNNDQLIYY